jgi:2-desacetyl-2-hydroxyethyl bacteriochlorophyllide A dehydrogenase
MKALVWRGPRDLRIQEVPDLTPQEHEVLLRVDVVGICGSELSGYLGESSLRRPPLIMGHEFCGTVVALGPDVGGVAVGDHVGVNPAISDGLCPLCRIGRQNLCLARTIIGVHRPGAFADYVVAPARACHSIPADLDHSGGALIEPVACAVRVIEVGRVSLGDRVLVIGAGSVGLTIIQAARTAGAECVIATDTNPRRLTMARSVGASEVIEPSEGPVDEQVRQLTAGLGCDLAVDAVGLALTRRQAIASVRRGGRVIFFGLHEDETEIPGNVIVRSEIELLGAFTYTLANFETAVAMVTRGSALPDPSWCEVRPLADGPDAFRQLLDDPSSPAKIQLRP